ncbi:MAG: hypothetical protein ACRCT8_17090 [Lacipirellulaceae bacterium]
MTRGDEQRRSLETQYGALWAAALDGPSAGALGQASADPDAAATLRQFDLAAAFSPKRVANREAADCCLAAAWLAHGELDEAHALAQAHEGPVAAYWHGVVHRREGDFGNAEYWFDRAGEAPWGALLATAALTDPATASLGARGQWDARGFVALCRTAVRGDATLIAPCESLQLAEWRAAFDGCFRAAAG